MQSATIIRESAHDLYAQTSQGQVLSLNDGAHLGYDIASAYEGFKTQTRTKELYKQYEESRLKYEKHVRQEALKTLQAQADKIPELAEWAGFSAAQSKAMGAAGADLESYLLGNIKASEELAHKKGE